ncbi:MAG TPA: sigma 54-interacting transcriptional regulator [Bacillota bacterium]|nr:sigma 54-interacting transcriptional regulator [Bacillota bacterium]HPL54005.1 sigma 54-interacting transcriptional regulator [Bacillota bacterium]
MNFIYKSIIDAILKNTDIGIHVVDSAGKAIIYNQAMADMEGLDIHEVMGKSILDIFPSLTHETSTLLTVLKTRKPIYNKFQTYLNHKGKQINTLNSTIPIMISPGKHGALEIAKNITKEKELAAKLVYLQQELASKDIDHKSLKGYTFRNIIGEDEKFLEAIEVGRKAAMSSSTVLISGETGTGKELFAQSIHNGSSRKRKPFIAQNCAALPESLLEGILFGTVKGSFTGAINRPGLFEQANGGSLLLDEINSMGHQLQAKLLRVLQEGYVRRVGGLADIPIDVRILATTNEDPLLMLNKGILRKDLYYRLNVITVTIPSLKERKTDIPLLTDHFIKKYNNILQKDIWYVSSEVGEAFMHYDWPGNVRELENIIESAINMINSGHIIKSEHISPDMRERLFKPDGRRFGLSLSEDQSLDNILKEVEKSIILETMQESGNNISRCSEKLGIKRQTLQHKLKKYGIRV